MSATTQDRNTPYIDGQMFEVPAAAGVIIPAGTIVCTDANGYAVPGAATAGLAYLGRAEEHVNNRDGATGDVHVMVRRLKAFRWANDSGDAVTQASVGRDCYVADNQTVSKSDGGGTRPRAGVVLTVSTDGVLVY